MEEEKYTLVHWSDLPPEALEIIKANEAKNNKGYYIKPEDYEKSSFYVDKEGRVARGKDVDNWRWSSEAERLKMLQEDPDFFENLWHRIDETFVSGNPLISDLRVENFRKALSNNSNFMGNWDLYLNVRDGIHMASGGLDLMVLPSHLVGIAKALYQGKPIFTGENGLLGAYWENSGIVPEGTNPYVAAGANLLFDAAVGGTISGIRNYRRTPIHYGGGAEMEDVWTYPGDKYVYKKSYRSPELLQSKRGDIGRTVPMELVDETLDGGYIYKLLKLDKPKPVDYLKVVDLFKKLNFFERLYPGDSEPVFYNPFTRKVAVDVYLRNYGLIPNTGEIGLYDYPHIFDEAEYLTSTMKKGGKLIPKARHGIVAPSDNTANVKPVLIRTEGPKYTRELIKAEISRHRIETRNKLAAERGVPVWKITELDIDDALRPVASNLATISATTPLLKERRKSGQIKTLELKKAEEEAAKDAATRYNDFGPTIGRPLIDLDYAAQHPEWVEMKTNEAAHLLPDAFATGLVEGAVVEAPTVINAVKSNPMARQLAEDALKGEILSELANEIHYEVTGKEKGYMADALSPITSKIENPYAREAVEFIGGLFDPAFYMGPSVIDKGIDLSRVIVDKAGKIIAPLAPKIKSPSFKYPENNTIKQKGSYYMEEPSNLDLIEIEKWLSENPDALGNINLTTPETILEEAIDKELSNKLNKTALDYYSSEVYPRLAYTPKVDIETGEFYLEPSENIASPELFSKSNRPIKVVDDVTMMELGLYGNNGVHYNDGYNIVWNKSPNPDLSGIHETLHGKDGILEPLVYPYFSEMHDNLVNAYAIKEAENRLVTKYGEEYLNNLSDEEYYKLGHQELANISLEINNIFKNIGVASAENGKSMEELRALLKKRNLNIDDLSDSQLIELYEPINGYTTQYTKMLRLENPTGIDSYLGLDKTGSYSYIKGSPTYKMYGSNEFVNRLRFAVKYLPVVGGAVVVGSQALDGQESYKQGGRLIPKKRYIC